VAETRPAKLARILERTWDQGEWHNSSDGSFCKANRSVCRRIDLVMDVFMGLIVNFSKKTPDPAALQTAYNDFLEKRKQDD
jgi:hypothetical protein